MKTIVPRVYNIPAGEPFLRRLAETLCDPVRRSTLFGDHPLEDITIFLPTRRAARWLANDMAHLMRHNYQRSAVLLPALRAIGDVDEEGAEGGHFDVALDTNIAPVVGVYERIFFLSSKITIWMEKRGRFMTASQSAALASDLVRFFDQAQGDDVQWEKLRDIVPDEFAENWQETIDFLNLIIRDWPDYLKDKGRLDPVARRNLLMDRLGAYWQKTPPSGPVIAAGSTGTMPATARLLSVIAHLPNGAVVLPGLDQTSPNHVWDAVMDDPSHAQRSMAGLLNKLNLSRKEVAIWPGAQNASPRFSLLSAAMAPASQTGDWASLAKNLNIELGTKGLHLLEAPDAPSEAGAIAVIMREALEVQDKTAALITPDRNLARRVAAELRRWGIEVDDSGGLALRQTPAAALSLLVLSVVETKADPVQLLALLKHPLCHMGQARATHIRHVRAMESLIFRGPVPSHGIGAYKKNLSQRANAFPLKSFPDVLEHDIRDLLDRVEHALTPIMAIAAEASFKDFCLAFKQSISQICYDGERDNFVQNEAGLAVLALLDQVVEQAEGMASLSLSDWHRLVQQWMDQMSFRPKGRVYSRLNIWGPLEARLLQTDLVILGGLNEGVWPPVPETGPWLSRPMRSDMEMSLPERRIGLAAHDFIQNACAAEVIMTRAKKVDGTPTVAARWLRRLTTLAKNIDTSFPHMRLHWWRSLDAPHQVIRAPRPNPRPPIHARPNRLSVTQIETLMTDPYRIYAQHILRLPEWDRVAAPSSAAHRGTLLHQVFERFTKRYPDQLPENAHQALLDIAYDIGGSEGQLNEGLILWRARLDALAGWLSVWEVNRRLSLTHISSEIKGEIKRDIAGKVFTISAKADRIDELTDGSFEILDYKTGAIPSGSDIKSFFSVQLVLAAAIMRVGGFENLSKGRVKAINYIKLSGGVPPGEFMTMPIDDAFVDEGLCVVERLLAAYADERVGYLSRLRQKRIHYETSYDHLARFAEWGAYDDQGDGA